jgi:hypothetical protein
MTKGNWVSGPNARLGRTADWADEKNMAESMGWVRKIIEGILAIPRPRRPSLAHQADEELLNEPLAGRHDPRSSPSPVPSFARHPPPRSTVCGESLPALDPKSEASRHRLPPQPASRPPNRRLAPPP